MRQILKNKRPKSPSEQNRLYLVVLAGALMAYQNCSSGFEIVEPPQLASTLEADPVPDTPDDPVDPVDPVDPADPADPVDPMEPTNPTEDTRADFLFTGGFEQDDWMSKFGLSGGAGFTSRVSSPSVSGSALKLRYLNNQVGPQNGGLDKRGQARFSTLGFANREEGYLRYYVRFPNGFDWGADGGKLPGFGSESPVSGCPGSDAEKLNGWSARYMWAAGGGLKAYIYAMPQGEWDKPCGQGVSASNFKFVTNRWYSLEQYVKLNSPGQANGILKVWVDGNLVIERTNIPYRNSGAESLKIGSLFFSTFYGGSRGPTQGDQELYLDNFVIAPSLIGPLTLP